MEKENIYYVYEWYNIDTGEVFYVGKGKLGRYKNVASRNKFFQNYYNTHKCDVRKVYEGLTEEEAFDKEVELIAFYKTNTSFRLTNQTDGGEGSSGIVVSDEFRRKMSELVKGEKNPNYGHKWSEEQKEAARQRALKRNYNGKNNPNYGHKWSKEQKERASERGKKDPSRHGENHGRATKRIILETGEVYILKSRIQERCRELLQQGIKTHWVNYEPYLDDKNERIKLLIKILQEKSHNRLYDIFITLDGNIIYGKSNLAKRCNMGVHKLNRLINEQGFPFTYNNITYYKIENSPFTQ